MTVLWTRSGDVVTADEHFLIDQTPIQLGPLLYQASLAIRGLDGDGGDDGTYSCDVHIVSSSDHVLGASAQVSKHIGIEGNYIRSWS